jgi:hypothetical protein
MQQPQPYGQQPPPAAYTARPMNSLAIVSLAAGISAYVITHFIGAIVAIVTGHMARGQMRRTGERGGAMALVGLILGYAYFAVLILVIAVVVVLIVSGVAIFGANGSS